MNKKVFEDDFSKYMNKPVDCGCPNNFSEEVFKESFGSDGTMENCSACSNFNYKEGLMTCKKFN